MHHKDEGSFGGVDGKLSSFLAYADIPYLSLLVLVWCLYHRTNCSGFEIPHSNDHDASSVYYKKQQNMHSLVNVCHLLLGIHGDYKSTDFLGNSVHVLIVDTNLSFSSPQHGHETIMKHDFV